MSSLENAPLMVTRGLPKSFFRFRLLGSAVGGVIGLIVLAGHAFSFEPAWRWVPSMPATHPYTALCLVMLAIGLGPLPAGIPAWRRWSDATLIVVIALLFLRLTAPLIGWELFDALTPFPIDSETQIAGKKPIFMPANVATAMLCLAFGEALRRYRRPIASQFFACGAVAFLFMGVTGFLGGLSGFWGTVGPATLLGMTALTATLLFGTVRHGFMRAVTASSEPGRLARLLLGSSTVLLLLIGWVVSRRIDNPGIPLPADGFLLVYETAAVTALIWVMVAVSSLRADRVDRHRSVAERLLQRTSTRDGLTGLLTRNRMTQLRTTRSRPSLPSASLFIDLDRFRSVNETQGYHAGDRVLSLLLCSKSG